MSTQAEAMLLAMAIYTAEAMAMAFAAARAVATGMTMALVTAIWFGSVRTTSRIQSCANIVSRAHDHRSIVMALLSGHGQSHTSCKQVLMVRPQNRLLSIRDRIPFSLSNEVERCFNTHDCCKACAPQVAVGLQTKEGKLAYRRITAFCAWWTSAQGRTYE